MTSYPGLDTGFSHDRTAHDRTTTVGQDCQGRTVLLLHTVGVGLSKHKGHKGTSVTRKGKKGETRHYLLNSQNMTGMLGSKR